MKKKLVRITTVPLSLEKLLEGQLAFMNNYFEVTAVSSDNKYLKNIGKKEGVSTFCVEMTRKITPFKDIIAVIKLYWFFKKQQPYIVHTHTPKAGIIGMLAAKMANVPNRFHTVAGLPLLEFKGFKRSLLNFVEKLTYKCATKVYPNSKGLKEIIIKNNLTTKNKLKVLANGSSNGINTAYFSRNKSQKQQQKQLKFKLEIKETDFVFIFVGRLVGDKGINELIESFRQLNEHYNFIKLLLVGPFEPNLDPLKRETIQEINANKNIISVGYQIDVSPYFAIANVLVFPSYREGFPNVVMQAGAMELPSIVTNINGCNEIILEAENGWLIPPKNRNELFKAMKNCLTNDEAYLFAKNNARKLIENRFEQHLVWEAILKEYQSIEQNV